MVMKSFLICLSLILFFGNKIDSFEINDYISAVEELMLDPNFVEEYKEWSFELFSDPDYLYGKKPGAFPCQIPTTKDRNEPTTVHNLRPIDVQCVGAIGDSLTAALGAQAATPVGLFTENRGLSWSIGGDYTYDTSLTLPNILREYNPNLKGFSTKNSLIIGKGQNSSHNALNTAESGDVSYQMVDQAHMLYQRVSSGKYCDLNNDWKVITLLVGGNDLCLFCQEPTKHMPSNYTDNVRQALDFFHENFPRTFVNLVLVLDVRNVEKLNKFGVCTLLHRRTCPCAAFPSASDNITLNEYLPLYQQQLLDLVNSGRYDTRDDFTVVVQPFMAHTPLPLKADNQSIDFGYFAPDCFHFSGRGHSRAALALWNNMLEPVGKKAWEWHEGETIDCPKEDRPYFATRKNSPQPFEKIPQF